MITVKTKEHIFADKLSRHIHMNSMNKVTGFTTDTTAYKRGETFKQYTGCLSPLTEDTYKFILTYVEYGKEGGVSRQLGIVTDEEREIVEFVLKTDYKLEDFEIF